MIPDGEQSAWEYGNIILCVGKKVQVIKITILTRYQRFHKGNIFIFRRSDNEIEFIEIKKNFKRKCNRRMLERYNRASNNSNLLGTNMIVVIMRDGSALYKRIAVRHDIEAKNQYLLLKLLHRVTRNRVSARKSVFFYANRKNTLVA